MDKSVGDGLEDNTDIVGLSSACKMSIHQTIIFLLDEFLLSFLSILKIHISKNVSKSHYLVL